MLPVCRLQPHFTGCRVHDGDAAVAEAGPMTIEQVLMCDHTSKHRREMLDGRQLNFQRLLFCLDREHLSCMKLVLAQFKKGTKEPEYLETIQQQTFSDLEQIVPFVYRDKLFSCISNYAYVQA